MSTLTQARATGLERNQPEYRRATLYAGAVRYEMARRAFDRGAISPEDKWAFELLPEEILGVSLMGQRSREKLLTLATLRTLCSRWGTTSLLAAGAERAQLFG
jgi:hypothetical protein